MNATAGHAPRTFFPIGRFLMDRRFPLWLWMVGVTWCGTTVYADEPAARTVAHIRLAGTLDEAPLPTDPLFGGNSENFKSKLDRIKKAQKDDNIHALLLQIDELGIGWGKLDELSRALAAFR